MSKKHIGSSLSSFLDEMNIREETELLALKKTLSFQLRKAMKRRSVSQSRLAKEMRTSRTVINRILDPSDTGVTLATLTRASQVLGLRPASNADDDVEQSSRSRPGRGSLSCEYPPDLQPNDLLRRLPILAPHV